MLSKQDLRVLAALGLGFPCGTANGCYTHVSQETSRVEPGSRGRVLRRGSVPVRTGCVTVTEGPRAHTPLAKTDTHPRGLFKVWPPQTYSNSITWDLAGVSSPLSPSPREAGGEGGGRPGHLWVNTPSGATDVPNQAGDGLPQARSVSPHPADTGPAAGGRGELGGLPHSSSTKPCIKQRGH